MSSKTALRRVLLKLLPLSKGFYSVSPGRIERPISKNRKDWAPRIRPYRLQILSAVLRERLRRKERRLPVKPLRSFRGVHAILG